MFCSCAHRLIDCSHSTWQAWPGLECAHAPLRDSVLYGLALPNTLDDRSYAGISCIGTGSAGAKPMLVSFRISYFVSSMGNQRHQCLFFIFSPLCSARGSAPARQRAHWCQPSAKLVLIHRAGRATSDHGPLPSSRLLWRPDDSPCPYGFSVADGCLIYSTNSAGQVRVVHCGRRGGGGPMISTRGCAVSVMHSLPISACKDALI